MFVGVKMAVCLKGGFYVFMAQPVSNQQGGEAFFDEKGSVGMPQIVNPNSLYPGSLTPSNHFMEKIAFSLSEKPP